MIIHVDNLNEFNEKIASGRVLVDFFATWCGPCKMLSPILEEVDARGEAGDLLIVKVDVDEAGEIAAKYGIQSIPTLILFENGKAVKSQLGYMPKPQLLNFLK
jgi:thioredoxin 1